MDIYNYNFETGEFISVSKADPDPLVPDRWLVPAFATTVLPPECSKNEVALFNGDKWSISPDFRGTDYWSEDGVKHTISKLGQDVPTEAILETPPSTSVNQTAIIKNGRWVIVPDLRGTEYWLSDGSKHAISEVGIELPEGALLEQPKLPPTLENQTKAANTECTRRIEKHWNQIGQINAALGIYGADDTAACEAWILSNRAALISLLEREDLLEIDVSDDQHWPIFEGSN